MESSLLLARYRLLHEAFQFISGRKSSNMRAQQLRAELAPMGAPRAPFSGLKSTLKGLKPSQSKDIDKVLISIYKYVCH